MVMGGFGFEWRRGRRAPSDPCNGENRPSTMPATQNVSVLGYQSEGQPVRIDTIVGTLEGTARQRSRRSLQDSRGPTPSADAMWTFKQESLATRQTWMPFTDITITKSATRSRNRRVGAALI